MTLKALLASNALALTLGLAPAAPTAAPLTGVPQDFFITSSANGQISGTLDGLQVVDDLKVAIADVVELHDLAPALLQLHVLRNDRSKLKEGRRQA